MDSNQDLFSLQIDPLTKNHLYETAKWGKFLSICGFIMCGLILLAAIAAPATLTARLEDQGYGEASGPAAIVTIITYIVFSILYFFPLLMLYRFSTKMKNALQSGNQEILNSSFDSLRSLFKFVGILTIIMLLLVALIVLMAIIGLAARG